MTIDYVALFYDWTNSIIMIHNLKLNADFELVLKKRAVRGTRHVMTLNFLRMTTRPGKVFKYVVGPLIGEIKYYNLQSVRRDPLSTTYRYGGRSELAVNISDRF